MAQCCCSGRDRNPVTERSHLVPLKGFFFRCHLSRAFGTTTRCQGQCSWFGVGTLPVLLSGSQPCCSREYPSPAGSAEGQYGPVPMSLCARKCLSCPDAQPGSWHSEQGVRPAERCQQYRVLNLVVLSLCWNSVCHFPLPRYGC